MLCCWRCHFFLCAVIQQITPVQHAQWINIFYNICRGHLVSNLGFAWFSSKRCLLSVRFCLFSVSVSQQYLSKFKFVLSFFPSWLIPVSGGKGGWVMMAVRTLLRDLVEICFLKRQYYSITLLKSSACCCLWCTEFLMHEAVTKKVLYFSGCLCLQVEWFCLLFRLHSVWARKKCLPTLTGKTALYIN